MCKENSNLINNRVYDNTYIDLTTGLKNKNYIVYKLAEAMRCHKELL
ncbi:hypothetical protein [Clostridium sp.]